MPRYRFVKAVGIELEGGWDNPPRDRVEDGSVEVSAEFAGELPSPILTPLEIEEWVLTHYPDVQGPSCGMHVHVSVHRVGDYGRLMEPEFGKYLMKRIHDWGKVKKIIPRHPLWDRLAGRNSRYCAAKFHPELQYLEPSKGSARYTQLNYTWTRYGTVECRVLPMFKVPKIAVSAVQNVVDGFEEYLRTVPKRDPMLRKTLKSNEITEPSENMAEDVEEEIDTSTPTQGRDRLGDIDFPPALTFRTDLTEDGAIGLIGPDNYLWPYARQFEAEIEPVYNNLEAEV